MSDSTERNLTARVASCPRCGAATTGGRFCIHCGADLDAIAAAAPPGEDGEIGHATIETPAVSEADGTWPQARPGFVDGSPDDRVGMLLGGRYRVEEVIGRGGFGTVYRGTHLGIAEPVAIKFLHPELAASAEVRARFRREAKALARLRHPGIVAVHDFGADASTLYLVMELVAGEPLQKQLCIDKRTMPLERVGVIFDQVLQVLEAAHAEGIVHRDMKPENVLLLRTSDRSEHVKVLDFGIALMEDRESAERLTATGVVQGTPLYMSPEQCRGRDVGPKTDVYAVGAMLFEALTGEPPFSGQGATDLMVKHMFVDPPAMRERGVRPALAAPLEALVRRALAKRPDDRPTAAALRDELRQVLAGTDAMSFAERAREQRIAATNLPREERGLPSAPRGSSAVGALAASVSVAGAGHTPRVVLWQLAGERAESLAESLAVHGLRAVTVTDGKWPSTAGDGARVVVLAGDAHAGERTAMLRADALTAKLPVLVIDLERAEDTPALIRAGASDVALALVGDDAICKKLKRLVQRGR